MNYQEVEWVEMKPDIYGGDPCGSEHTPRFEACADGDMGSETSDRVEYFANLLPAGAKITVSVPCCPNNCGLSAQHAINDICPCDFDWKKWAEEQYS